MLAAIAVAASSYGQGTVNFVNSTTTLIQINGVSAGAVAGAKVELLWAPVGTTDVAQFTVLGAAVNVGTPSAGRFSGGGRTVPAGSGLTGIAGGALANFIVRGFVGTDFVSANTRGVSSVFTVDTGDPTTTPAGTLATITGASAPLWNGNLNLTAVPEPTSMTLAGLGAAALLAFRRRK